MIKNFHWLLFLELMQNVGYIKWYYISGKGPLNNPDAGTRYQVQVRWNIPIHFSYFSVTGYVNRSSLKLWLLYMEIFG